MAVKDRLAEDGYRGEIEFEIVEREPERAVARMPIRPGVLNPFGTVHAGALIWFADVTATVCAMGDMAGVEESGKGFPLAVDLHTVLVANEREGVLTAEARPVRRGRRMTVIRTSVTGATGRLLIDMTTTHVPAG